jgi:hypothetical protein
LPTVFQLEALTASMLLVPEELLLRLPALPLLQQAVARGLEQELAALLAWAVMVEKDVSGPPAHTSLRSSKGTYHHAFHP